MKRIFLVIAAFAAFASAQAQSKMTVWQEDGSKTVFNMDNVTRVTFDYDDNTPDIPDGAVDLGLSVYWASCNLGAATPESYGDYHTWPGSGYTYSNMQSNGVIDASGCLTPKYDKASKILGGNWRMPSTADVAELHTQCTWTWTHRNGVAGFQVTGPNGNSIFLPAGGYSNGSTYTDKGVCGYYWYSNACKNNGDAIGFTLKSSGMGTVQCPSNYRLLIRPVTE